MALLVLGEALVGLLLAGGARVLLASQALVPRHAALAAPLMPADVAHEAHACARARGAGPGRCMR